MSDRSLRFAARMIAAGLLGVAWTIGTLAMVLVQQMSSDNWQPRVIAYVGLAPVAVLLLYIVVTDFADWRNQSRQQRADDDE